MAIKISNYMLNDAWVVSGGSVAGVKELEFTTENFKPDETDTGAAAGTAFNILDTIDFDPDTDGAVWFDFNLPEGFSSGSDISIDVKYALNGSDDGKIVYLNFKAWVIDAAETPVEGTPDIDQNDSITSGTSNTGKLNTITLTNSVIGNSHLNENTLRIACKLSRDADNVSDTYTGTFQLVSLKLYQ